MRHWFRIQREMRGFSLSLSVCLSVCPSVCPSVCLSVTLSPDQEIRPNRSVACRFAFKNRSVWDISPKALEHRSVRMSQLSRLRSNQSKLSDVAAHRATFVKKTCDKVLRSPNPPGMVGGCPPDLSVTRKFWIS